jgi:hypothetical protein
MEEREFIDLMVEPRLFTGSLIAVCVGVFCNQKQTD